MMLCCLLFWSERNLWPLSSWAWVVSSWQFLHCGLDLDSSCCWREPSRMLDAVCIDLLHLLYIFAAELYDKLRRGLNLCHHLMSKIWSLKFCCKLLRKLWLLEAGRGLMGNVFLLNSWSTAPRSLTHLMSYHLLGNWSIAHLDRVLSRIRMSHLRGLHCRSSCAQWGAGPSLLLGDGAHLHVYSLSCSVFYTTRHKKLIGGSKSRSEIVDFEVLVTLRHDKECAQSIETLLYLLSYYMYLNSMYHP